MFDGIYMSTPYDQPKDKLLICIVCKMSICGAKLQAEQNKNNCDFIIEAKFYYFFILFFFVCSAQLLMKLTIFFLLLLYNDIAMFC